MLAALTLLYSLDSGLVVGRIGKLEVIFIFGEELEKLFSSYLIH